MARPAPLAVVPLVAASLLCTGWQLFCQKIACWPAHLWENQFLHLVQVVLPSSSTTAHGGCCCSMALEVLSSVGAGLSVELAAGVVLRRVVVAVGVGGGSVVLVLVLVCPVVVGVVVVAPSLVSTRVFRGSALLCRLPQLPLPVL